MLLPSFALIAPLVLLQAKEPADLASKIFAQIQQLQETVGYPSPKPLSPSEHHKAMDRYLATMADTDKFSQESPDSFKTRIMRLGLRQIQSILDLRTPPKNGSIYITSNQYLAALQQVHAILKGSAVLKDDNLFSDEEIQKQLGLNVLDEKDLLSEYLKNHEPIPVLTVSPARIKSDLIEIYVGKPVFEVRDGRSVFAISDWGVVYIRYDCSSSRYYISGTITGGI